MVAGDRSAVPRAAVLVRKLIRKKRAGARKSARGAA